MFLADRCSYPVFFLFPRFVHVLSFVDKDLRVCQNAKYAAALSAFRQENHTMLSSFLMLLARFLIMFGRFGVLIPRNNAAILHPWRLGRQSYTLSYTSSFTRNCQ